MVLTSCPRFVRVANLRDLTIVRLRHRATVVRRNFLPTVTSREGGREGVTRLRRTASVVVASGNASSRARSHSDHLLQKERHKTSNPRNLSLAAYYLFPYQTLEAA